MQFYHSKIDSSVTCSAVEYTSGPPHPYPYCFIGGMGLSDQASEMHFALDVFHKCPGTQFVSPLCRIVLDAQTEGPA